jgi:hypothetical protein
LPASERKLQGHLDHVRRDLIEGWARDEASPDTPVRLRILDNGVPIAEVVADRYRADLLAAGFGSGRHCFVHVVPGGLSPLTSHVIDVQRVSDGQKLGDSPQTLDGSADNAPVAPPAVAEAASPELALPGFIDITTRDRIEGWVHD